MLLKLNIEAISRTLRSIQPAHYLFKVESLSVLLNTDIEKYESGSFEVGGYKWWVYFESSFLPFFFPAFARNWSTSIFAGACVSTQMGIKKVTGKVTSPSI